MLNQWKLQQIEDNYNPEFDIPQHEPQVSWVEYELLHAVKILEAQVQKLEEEVAQLRDQLEVP